MNVQDNKKFIDVCVEITKYGKVASCEVNEVDYVIKQIDDIYINGFERFLRDKANLSEFEDPDIWDNWYDNLTLDQINEHDIKMYDLPSEKIKVSLGNEDVFVRAMYLAAQEFVESCSFVNPKNDNFEYGYHFDTTGIFVYFVSRNNTTCPNGAKYNSVTRSKINDQFKKCIDSFYKARTNFSKVTGMTFPKYVTVYRNDDFEPGCNTGRCIYFTKEDLTNDGQTTIPKDYAYKFFRIINDSKVIK